MSANRDSCRVLVVVPTYQEADNVENIVRRTLAAVRVAHVLVVDDDSPDGTGEIAARLAAADHRVHVLNHAGKQGLGAAYLAGFRWALKRNYDAVVEMDADGSHQPEQLPRLLAALDSGADLVLGSRWIPGGAVENWPWSRQMLSRAGNCYVRVALGIPLRDATAGYRVFRRSTLERLDLSDVTSQGYCFQIDLAWRTSQAGLRVLEVPITFVERERGASKMSSAIVREALWRVTVWGARRLLPRRRPSATVPTALSGVRRWVPRPPLRSVEPPTTDQQLVG